MPIFEFTCRGCGERFEALVRTGDVPECPACKSRELEKVISLFAVNSDSTRSSALASGRRRAQKQANEKAIADREYLEKHDH